MTKNATNPNQLTIPHSAVLVPENEYAGVAPETRISLGRLVAAAGATIAFGTEPTRHDFMHAEPGAINHGLYIHPNEARYPRAQHIITVGVSYPSPGKDTSDYGVVFPSTEFDTVARNSRDFGHHIVNKTRKAVSTTDPERDRDDAYNDTMRSAAHALIKKWLVRTHLLQTILMNLRHSEHCIKI